MDLGFESKIHSTSFDTWCQKVLGFSGATKKSESSQSEEGLLEVAFFDEKPPRFGASGVPVDDGVSYFCCCLKEFIFTLEMWQF